MYSGNYSSSYVWGTTVYHPEPTFQDMMEEAIHNEEVSKAKEKEDLGKRWLDSMMKGSLY